MCGVQNTFDFRLAMGFFALGHKPARIVEIVQNAVGVGPLPEEVIVLEEMIMAEGRMGHDERLHRHGVLFHIVTDAGIGIDDDFIRQSHMPFAVGSLLTQEGLSERPMAIHQRHAD